MKEGKLDSISSPASCPVLSRGYFSDPFWHRWICEPRRKDSLAINDLRAVCKQTWAAPKIWVGQLSEKCLRQV